MQRLRLAASPFKISETFETLGRTFAIRLKSRYGPKLGPLPQRPPVAQGSKKIARRRRVAIFGANIFQPAIGASNCKGLEKGGKAVRAVRA